MRPASCLLLLLCAFALAACGDDDPDAAARNPQAVFQAVMRDLHDGDWIALQENLTRDARRALEADMRRLRTNLATPEPNSPLIRVVQHQLGEGWQQEVDTAVRGGMPAMLRFFVKLSPRPREPSVEGVLLEPGTRGVKIPYRLDSGEERVVVLVQQDGRWYVAQLPL